VSDVLGVGVPDALDPLFGPLASNTRNKINDVLAKDTHTTLSALIQGAGATSEEAPIMVAISLSESGGKANATHRNTDGTQDTGLWMINDVHHGAEPIPAFRKRMLLPTQNAKQAVAVLHSQGLTAWTDYRNKKYQRFMGKDTTVVTDKDTVTGSLSGVGDILKTTEQVAGALLNPSTYLRLGKGLLGGLLVVVGIGGLVFVVGKQVNPSAIAKAVVK
jgi:hypothetical protein